MSQDTALAQQALLGCAQEPIRVPGAIQPHGVWLGLAEPDLTVLVASANASALLGVDPAGRRLEDAVGTAAAGIVRDAARGELAEVNPLSVEVGGVLTDVVLHRSGHLLVAEWEPMGSTVEGVADRWHRRLPSVLERLASAGGLSQLAQVLATDIRRLTGYDRVMIYRFDPDWNGEVIAEHKRADLAPFLGLHFPASDIPPQARALYETNWLRIIPDAGYTPVPLLPSVDLGTGAAIDLSQSMLRSVSPVHLEYLANMGVASSMSVSLIDRGRLWGLIACHHYAGPHRPTYRDRLAAEFLGRTASLLLGSAVDSSAGDRMLEVSRRHGELMAALGRTPREPAEALTEHGVTLLDLIPAGGAAIRLQGRLTLLGETPEPERVQAIVRSALAAGVSATDQLSGVVPDAETDTATASGLLAVPLGGAGGDFLAWFRPETLREVTWGGDPATAKLIVLGEDGPRIGPRRSFDQWSEIVRATATPWEPHEVAAARDLAAHLSDLTTRRTHEDNRLAATLQRTLLLEQLPTIPGLALGARYLPSAQEVVGGDWYDLVVLPGGNVSIVLGDVAGHGLGAAAITAQLRHALRANLLRNAGPAAALHELNGLLAALLPDEMATAVVAEVDPATGRVAVANAGHLPVLARTSAGARYLDEGMGPALGLVGDARYQEQSLTLGRGDRLILFSDGLVERRVAGLQQGLDELRGAAAVAAVEPDALLDALLSALTPGNADDVTVVAFGPT